MLISPYVLEIVNGVLLTIYAALAYVFSDYMTRQWWRGNWNWNGNAGAAAAMLILMVGEALIRVGVWIPRHLLNHNRSIEHLTILTTSLVVLGTLVASWGGVCMLRLFVPARFQVWAPVCVVSAALLFGIGMAI